jgi:hypothetical protein
MLVKRCKNFSGFFQFQKGKLQYSNPITDDFFEINTTLIQALQIQKTINDKTMVELNIIANYQIVKSIQIPTHFAKDIKHWIYLNLHFLGKKDSQNCHNDVQPIEVIKYRRSQRIKNFCLTTICILLLASLSRSLTESNQINQLKIEAKYLNISDLLVESKKQIDNGEFNEGIHNLLLVNAVKPSKNIRTLLDDAYFKRGKYYINTGNIPLAKQDFLHIMELKKEKEPFLLMIKQYEDKRWIGFSDFTDLIQFSWDTFISNLDHGKNKARSEEMNRTWTEFQEKIEYTGSYHPLWGGIKDFFITTIY